MRKLYQVSLNGRVDICALSTSRTGSCLWKKDFLVCVMYIAFRCHKRVLTSFVVKKGGDKMSKTKKLILVSLLIAMEIVLTRFLAIETPVVRIGLGFIPMAIAGTLFGPVTGGIAYGVSDILGMLLLPKSAYFPGFTISAVLSGAMYGIFLYKKDSYLRIILCVLAIGIAIDLGLNTFWLSIILGKGYLALLPVRIVKTAIMLPIQVISIKVVGYLVLHSKSLNLIKSVK